MLRYGVIVKLVAWTLGSDRTVQCSVMLDLGFGDAEGGLVLKRRRKNASERKGEHVICHVCCGDAFAGWTTTDFEERRRWRVGSSVDG